MRNKKLGNYFVSIIYAIGRFSLGLLTHPYQTMQLLNEQKIFIWLSLLPSIVLMILSMSWRLILQPLLWLGAEYIEFLDKILQMNLVVEMGSFVMIWVICFCFYWQVMVLYLLFRFSSVFK